MVSVPGPGDLTACEQEPIHVPGSIQPHGFLFALDPRTRTITRVSANVRPVVGTDPERSLGRPLGEALPGAEAPWDELVPDVAERATTSFRTIALGGSDYHAFVHRAGGELILELENATPGGRSLDALYPQMRAFIEELQSARVQETLAAVAARQVRRITGFDRVLVYQFDSDWNGTVIAEDRNDRLPSYLDLRFPASDIPRQARELYRLNRLRLIPDAAYRPVPILSSMAGAPPLDLSFSVLRSVSPIHVEYMRNMGTASSMSVSILVEGTLWGLISCHNMAPRHVSPAVRDACDLLAQILAVQIAAKQQTEEAAHRLELRSIQLQLLAHMATEDRFIDGLTKNSDQLLRMAGAEGAAIIFGGECACIGRSPVEEDVRRMVEWLVAEGHEDLFVTSSLAAVMPDAEALKDTASGVLAIAISKLRAGYVLWFRPEVVRTVKWGGDPRKPVDPTPDGARLHPRKSFDLWKETVRLTSEPWRASEVETARDLRNAVVGIVLRKAEEVADLVAELERSNKELESFSYSVSHDLRAPFRHIVGFAELLRESATDLTDTQRRYVDTIIESAFSAGKLVDDLLSFSQMGRATLLPVPIEMNRLLQDVRRILAPDIEGRDIEWRIGELGSACADPVMMRLAVQNLLSNAIKYTRGQKPAIIEVGRQPDADEAATVFFVRDNGVGFDMAYVGKLFGVFQRLHRVEEFEGTGIGLANVQRIMERHGGRAWAEAVPNVGATFYFSLPRQANTR
ncbi:MAG TPA: ATP-binding protein [Beijerinckiaceae bacterium]|nr:ATP-binding protein [Beijerinckiaceae bacterium]